MRSALLRISTAGRRVCDLTDQVRAFARDSRSDGIVHLFAPHATAGLALMETGSGSEADLDDLLEGMLPREDRYAHRHGSPGHGGDHLFPVLVTPSLVVPVLDGQVQLGTWQSVVLIDPNRDNDQRTVRLSFIPAEG
jgi:secondary thiamine-phosphate synthase enzyme